MIISLHIPKSAGTSFKLTLKDYFGNRLVEDYGSRPLRLPFEKSRKKAESFGKRIKLNDYNEVDCIHGHFLAVKYSAFLGKAAFITWLRNPVDRLYSNYYHIVRGQDAFKKTIPYLVNKEAWTLEEYCFHPLMKNYCSNFFWKFDISNFEFVGIVENYQTDLHYFMNKYLASVVGSYMENTNLEADSYQIDSGLRSELEKFHSEDMALYHKAMEVSLARS